MKSTQIGARIAEALLNHRPARSSVPSSAPKAPPAPKTGRPRITYRCNRRRADRLRSDGKLGGIGPRSLRRTQGTPARWPTPGLTEKQRAYIAPNHAREVGRR